MIGKHACLNYEQRTDERTDKHSDGDTDAPRRSRGQEAPVTRGFQVDPRRFNVRLKEIIALFSYRWIAGPSG